MKIGIWQRKCTYLPFFKLFRRKNKLDTLYTHHRFILSRYYDEKDGLKDSEKWEKKDRKKNG